MRENEDLNNSEHGHFSRRLVDTDDIRDSNQAEVTSKTISLELDSLSEKIAFPKCKGMGPV